MPLLTWTDEFSVGVDVIDNDHKLLINLINQLDNALKSGQGIDVVGSVLAVLLEYTHSHFAREELLLEKAGYGDLDGHRDVHRKLTTKVEGIHDRYLSGEEAIGGEVLEFLRDWLRDHILTVDMAYKDDVKGLSLSREEALRAAGINLDGADDDPVGLL